MENNVTILPPEDKGFWERQSILIGLDDYVKMKLAMNTVENIRTFVENNESKSGFLDKEKVMLLLGIIGGNE